MSAEKKSRGLKYLTEARPEAMEHLLQFFAESARHLDPKTRFLISVVTKVIAGSSRGMKQYARRALEAGATADEILDAILCAYPCAGLTRVVDAVDVILELDLPEFSLEKLERAIGDATAGDSSAAPSSPPDEGTWYRVAEVSSFIGSTGKRIDVNGRAIALFREGDRFHAIDDTCPHKGDSLAGGVAVRGEVACPLHGWQFRLEDGSCVNKPRARVRTFPTRVVDDRVEVFV